MQLTFGDITSIIALLVAAGGWLVTYGAKGQQVRDLKERVDKLEGRLDGQNARVSGLEIAFARVETLLGTIANRIEQISADINAS
jgi:hypothetical protein